MSPVQNPRQRGNLNLPITRAPPDEEVDGRWESAHAPTLVDLNSFDG